MTTVLIAMVVLLAVSVVPVMVAARLVDAPQAGFGSALLASFLYFLISLITEQMVADSWAASGITFLLGTLMLSIVLEISLLKALGVALLIMGIQLLLILIVFGGTVFQLAGA